MTVAPGTRLLHTLRNGRVGLFDDPTRMADPLLARRCRISGTRARVHLRSTERAGPCRLRQFLRESGSRSLRRGLGGHCVSIEQQLCRA